MRKSKALIVHWLFLLFLNLNSVNAAESSQNGVRSPLQQVNATSMQNKSSDKVLPFVAGVASGFGGKVVYDCFKKNGEVSSDHLETELLNKSIELKNANDKIERLTSDLERERAARVNADNAVVALQSKCAFLEQNQKKENEKDNNSIVLSKEQKDLLVKLMDQLSYRVAKMHIFGEDCACMARYLKKKNIDLTQWVRDGSGNLEKLAMRVHATGSACSNALYALEEWLNGDKGLSLAEVKKLWEERLRNLKEYDNDLC